VTAPPDPFKKPLRAKEASLLLQFDDRRRLQWLGSIHTHPLALASERMRVAVEWGLDGPTRPFPVRDWRKLEGRALRAAELRPHVRLYAHNVAFEIEARPRDGAVRIGPRRGTTFALEVDLLCRFGRPRGRPPPATARALAALRERDQRLRITGRIAVSSLFLEHEATSEEAQKIAARFLDMSAWRPAPRYAHGFRIG
jgi:hypothetical protein